MVSEKPVILITMGDAAGIGPEVVVKALAGKEVQEICRPVVIGEKTVLQETVKLTGVPLPLNPVDSLEDAEYSPRTVDVLDLNNINISDFQMGRISAACGRAAMEYVEKAARIVIEGKAGALVTAPINKEATKLSGYGDGGHLVYLARLTGTAEYATMLMSGCLRVVHLTTHYSLKEACEHVTGERIIARLRLTHKSFIAWGTKEARIAVAALNPHGGEGGLFGTEEIEEILPAVEDARGEGINAFGPIPADTVFLRAINGEFDAVLAMYHDQGHIPVKVHGFEESISVALGLPFVRTSVDHGTAFDIAGKGIADARSMVTAIKVAVNLVNGNGLVC